MLLKLYRTSLGPVLIAYNTIDFAQAVPINHHLDMIQGNNAPALAQNDLHFLHDDPYAAALAQSEAQSFAEIGLDASLAASVPTA